MIKTTNVEITNIIPNIIVEKNKAFSKPLFVWYEDPDPPKEDPKELPLCCNRTEATKTILMNIWKIDMIEPDDIS